MSGKKDYLNLGYPINLIIDTSPYGFNSRDILEWCLNNEIPEDVVTECMNDIDEHVRMCSSRMTDNERKSIMLRYEQHLTFSRIGKMLDLSMERARQIVSKAVRKLAYKSTAIFVLAKGISNDPEDVMKYAVMIKYGFMKHYDDLQKFPCYNRKKWADDFLNGEKPDISWFEKAERYQRIACEGIVAYTEDIELKMSKLIAEDQALIIENAKLKDDLSTIGSHIFDDETIDLIPIEVLKLSVRSYCLLKRSGYNTVGDLRKSTKCKIIKTRNCGKKSLNEIVDQLKILGIEIPEGHPND